MIVKAPHFYTMEGAGVGYKTGVAMLVDGGKIYGFVDNSVVERDYKADEVLDLPDHAVFPGLIDGHMHVQYNVLRGLAQDVDNWMMYGLQPFVNAYTPEDAQKGSRVAIIEAIKAGTTTIGDQDCEIDSVADFIKKIGARGNLALMFRAVKQKVYNPGELYEFDDALGEAGLKENIRMYNKWHDKHNMKVMFGPQGIDFVSPELLLRTQQAAKSLHTKLYIHFQQGSRETEQIMRRYGKRPTDFAFALGLPDKDLVAIHLTDCTDTEAERIAVSGASMVVNPTSIGIIDGIVCPDAVFQAAVGYVALGSDQSPGNNCHNIIHEMKNVCLFNKIKYANPEAMPAWKALRMATVEGATAIGIGDITGSLEEGKQADFIGVSLNHPSMLPVYTYPMRNIVPNFVYSARGEEVTLSVVAGRVIMKDRKILSIDEQECLDELKTCPATIGQKAAREFLAIDGPNARFMREERL